MKMPFRANLSPFAYIISGERSANRPNNYGTMLFMSKQVSLPKISSILQKMKIGQKCNIRPFCTKPFKYFLSILHKTHSAVILELSMKKTRAGKSHYSDVTVFEKFHFLVFSIQGGIFKYFWFVECFRKALLLRQITCTCSVDDRPNHRKIKQHFFYIFLPIWLAITIICNSVSFIFVIKFD